MKNIMKNQKGQTLVEFTLCFILLVIVAWIPADFGMMFYTSHIGTNAAREGAHRAAASLEIAQLGSWPGVRKSPSRISAPWPHATVKSRSP